MLIALFTYITLTGAAYACDPASFGFGKSVEAIVRQNSLDDEDISDESEAVIDMRGTKLCNQLPEDSVVNFVFFANRLVQVRIEQFGVEKDILQYAEKHLGQPSKAVNADAAHPNVQTMWSDNKKFTATYDFSAAREYLEITSSDESDLKAMNAFYIAEEKAKNNSEGGVVSE